MIFKFHSAISLKSDSSMADVVGVTRKCQYSPLSWHYIIQHVYVDVDICTYVYMYACVYVCMYICIYVCIIHLHSTIDVLCAPWKSWGQTKQYYIERVKWLGAIAPYTRKATASSSRHQHVGIPVTIGSTEWKYGRLIIQLCLIKSFKSYKSEYKW